MNTSNAEERFTNYVGALFDLTMGRGADGVEHSSTDRPSGVEPTRARSGHRQPSNKIFTRACGAFEDVDRGVRADGVGQIGALSAAVLSEMARRAKGPQRARASWASIPETESRAPTRRRCRCWRSLAGNRRFH